MVIMKTKARKTMNNSEKYRTILADEKPFVSAKKALDKAAGEEVTHG